MEPGATLGPYHLERELGAGGMGRVFRAVGPEGVVALKVVHPHLLENDEAVQRFEREVAIGKEVRHENVVQTFGGGETEGRHWIAMEFVEGQTLTGLLRELDRVPEELCRHIGRETAKGLGAIHAAGAIHRDIKPENIIISLSEAAGEDDDAERRAPRASASGASREGNIRQRHRHTVKIMDLGVARSTDDAMRLSQTGAFVGSLHYAAPEQFRGGGKGLDARVDLHALGLVLYELSSGTNPYYSDELAQVLRLVLNEQARRLGELNPQLSPFFEELVHRLIEKERDERFPNADELLEALDEGEDSAWWHERAASIRASTRAPLRRIRIPRETAVYGRDADLARLREIYALAAAGDGQVVLLDGEAGIGKSRLADELIGRLQSEGEELHFLFGSFPPGAAATASGAWSTAYREQLGDEGSAEYLTRTPLLVPAFDAMLRGEAAPPGEQALTKDSVQTCFVAVTRALAAERPTIVLIDDLHFAPEEGRALFTALATAVEGHPILLVGTTRPGVDDEWLSELGRLPQTTQMELQRLGPKDLVSLLQDTLQSDRLADRLAGQIGLKSDGNPFFVFEIIQGLREGQFIKMSADGTWVSTQVINEIEIPSSVRDLVNARVADLSEEERDLLDVACCWGYEFDPGLVGDVVGLGRIPVLKRFGRIERLHRIVRASGRNYAFDHHQVQESLYESLHEQMREEYHAALAEALEERSGAADEELEDLDGGLCVSLCEHFVKGRRWKPARRYLHAALDHLEASYLNDRVVKLAETALAAKGMLKGATRAATLLRLASPNRALDRMGLRDRQRAACEEGERLARDAGDADLAARLANALGVCLFHLSDHAGASAALARAMEWAEAHDDAALKAIVTGNQGLVVSSQGHHDDALALFGQSLELSRIAGLPEAEASAHGNRGTMLRVLGRPEEALEDLQRQLDLSRAQGNRRGEAVATGNLANVYRSLGRIELAQEHYERGLALCRDIGFRQGEVGAVNNLGNLFDTQGRLGAALDMLERALELCREMRSPEGEAIATHNVGAVLISIGDSEAGLLRLRKSQECARRIGLAYVDVANSVAIGAQLAAQADAGAAREQFDIALATGGPKGFADLVTVTRCQRALLPGGDPADALAAFAEHGARLDAETGRRVRYLLWKATGDLAHLAAARSSLDDAVADVSPEIRATMLANIPLHRDIMAASAASG